MRDIEFRGQREDTKEWVHGYYDYNPFFKKTLICLSDDLRSYVYEVIPDTVGQYTGLCDKNRKKIFEGDIVHIIGNQDVEDCKNVNYNALIIFKDGGFCAIDGTETDYSFRRYDLSRCDFDIEIIGNIFDNPKLLEDKK